MTKADVGAILGALGADEAQPAELAAAATIVRGLASILDTERDWQQAAEHLDDLARSKLAQAAIDAEHGAAERHRCSTSLLA